MKRARAVRLASLGALSASFALGLPLSATSHAAPVSQSSGTSIGSPALALAALDRKIADLDSEEQATKSELSGMSRQIAEAHTRVIVHGKSFYRLTRAGMLPVGGGFQHLVSHAMRVERARRAVAHDLELEKSLRTRGVELSRALERVARDRFALASQRTAMDAARIAMDDEVRRQAAFDKAFQSSGGAGGASSEYVAVYGGAGAGAAPDMTSHGGFQASRGRLLFPVAGRAEVRQAHREGTDGPGLEIHATLGTSVRAVFTGRVAFADRYGPYGRIVILDHGDHYYSVSGNLASIDVKIGADVAAGERVGTVGDDGQGAMLYFEIRHGSQTVPAGPWLGL
jgi:septal ring factor EnvC (AmiA/AmiB activator)